MVAPTRTPQARGVKCNLCKNILTLATWLDQTKLAKNVEEAQTVLGLIKQHEKTDCPCIPDSIKNLLVGSSHFEIHRLKIKALDLLVHKKQLDLSTETKQRLLHEQKKRANENINDCNEHFKTRSRFKIFPGHLDAKYNSKFQQLLTEQLRHLSQAIDFWKIALEDHANPFNSKLALRLGLTHHVIYACYLYKYYKIFDYQLISANLLVNLFKSIEGVTTNAIIHASFILIKTLIDCNQLAAARQLLKQAAKLSNSQDKSHYESILLACVSCELNFLESNGHYEAIQELAGLAVIKPDDKLQHYYARTLALATVIRYIHYHPAKTDLCFEFYHTFRYSCAIIRRCYESCFDLVLAEKDLTCTNGKQQSQNQILDHSWIRYAVCDFVFSTFDVISNFYIKSGQPEVLELLYNGLNLVAYRSGSCYWQTKMAAIGVSLDLLCDKYEEAKAKVGIISHVIGGESNQLLMNLLRLNLELCSLSIANQQNDTFIKLDVIEHLLERIGSCYNSFQEKIHKIELYDCKTNSSCRLDANNQQNNFIILFNNFGPLSLKVLKMGIRSLLRADDIIAAQELINKLAHQLKTTDTLEYYDCQTLLEILLYFADIERSESILLESVANSPLFLVVENSLSKLESELSLLTLNSDRSSNQGGSTTTSSTCSKRKTKPKIIQIPVRPRRRKGVYEVASRSGENQDEGHILRMFDTVEAVRNFSTLTKEEIVVAYLRNSEPNADYELYRRCHELMFSFKLRDENNRNHEQLAHHFCESNNTNTMRYRWMMYEEQQTSPYDPSSTKVGSNNLNLRYLGFANSLINPNKIMKLMAGSIPHDSRVIQVRCIVDQRAKKEHLLIGCLDSKQDSFYVHAEKPITSSLEDDFFGNSGDLSCEQLVAASLPSKMMAKIDDAKKTLFMKNQRDKSERRRVIESELGVLLHDMENDWLGPFRILFAGGKTMDANYDDLIRSIVEGIKRTMSKQTCGSEPALRLVVEKGPLLSRDEFCQLLGSIFNCLPSSNQVRDSFNCWLKSFDLHLERHMPGVSKLTYLLTLRTGQLGLMLDRRLELVPFESLPVVRVARQGVFRVPSLRLLHIISSRSNRIDTSSACYMLDPDNNLPKTRERFETKLKAKPSWLGTVGQPAKSDQLEDWLSNRDLYLYIGHGAGSAHYNKICKGRGLAWMSQLSSVAVVMGCSSGRVLAEGPRLESFGVSWLFILRGAPAYVGLLWDVTDTDIDKYLEALLANWLQWHWNSQNKPAEVAGSVCLSDAICKSRQVCEFKLLIGGTPVVYGLPVYC